MKITSFQTQTIQLFSLLFLILLSTFSIEVTAQCSRQKDSLQLIKIYNEFDGPNWANAWSLNRPLRGWDGILINGNGCVTIINLSSRRLKGDMSKFPTDFSEVTTLDVNNNNLNGIIPDLSGLEKITHLSLSNNQLSGTLPDFSSLEDLKNLSLNNNEFTGTLPDLSKFSDLKYFDFSNNQFSGTLPDISDLTNLIEFSCSFNQLTGPIPDLTQLKELTNVIISGNSFSGNFPDISKNEKLRTFIALNNQLTGSIPDLSNLALLEDFRVSRNKLTGSIPDISGLENLKLFFVGLNELNGTIPTLSNLPNLLNLDCAENQLTGEIPAFTNLPKISNISLRDNQLTGSIPDLSNLNSLQNLFVFNNQLSGCFPDFVCNLDNFGASRNPLMPWEGEHDNFCMGEPQMRAPCDTGDPDVTDAIIQPDCTCESALTNLSDIEENDIQIYPNPFTNTIHLNLNGFEAKKIILTNAFGQQIEANYSSTDQSIFINDTTSGIYFLTVHSNNGTKTLKLMHQ